MTWAEILTVLNFVIGLGVLVGGYASIRTTVARTSLEIQDRIREALKDENELLQSRVKRLEADIKRHTSLMKLLIVTLKKTRQIDMEISEDTIILRDQVGTHFIHIPTPETTED